VNKMDTSHFQEQARQDRSKLIAGIAVMAVMNPVLILIGVGTGSIALALGILAPVAVAALVCAGFLGLRLTKKMERDSYEEGMFLVMEGAPMSCTITDEKGAVLFCNDRASGMFKATKREYAQKLFGDFLPEIQPDGTRSMEMAGNHIQTAFKNGRDSFEWWHQMGPGAKRFPARLTWPPLRSTACRAYLCSLPTSARPTRSKGRKPRSRKGCRPCWMPRLWSALSMMNKAMLWM